MILNPQQAKRLAEALLDDQPAEIAPDPGPSTGPAPAGPDRPAPPRRYTPPMTRRRRRTLRLAMWACVACSAATGVTWGISGLGELNAGYTASEWDVLVSVNGGSLVVARIVIPPGVLLARGLHTSSMKYDTGHWRGVWKASFDPGDWEAMVPLWFLALLPLAPAFLCYRLSRRPISGLCPRCHYDLSGVPAGVCPECGTSPGS